ncbi:tail tape measure protein [Sphingomonas sp. Leaf24]|uniref:tail tape measure protein n=1 Tax=unclassified Sphingomonas TaxID=196159 RepID=UPI0006F29A80|nr:MULTISPECIES: tail tape measure protein [unclassified Sphingomonas]KQM14559.1 tail tape measure protein [Sphingomonas sp. Leaf5]KQM87860.1 tail tape measure protein [Sphingomonas sp. Leaf24]
MDEEIERLIVRVRADTAGFASDVAAMQASLDGPFAGGVERAGRAIETALGRAIRTGKLDLDDLRDTALKMLAEIAAAAVLGSGGGGGGVAGGIAGVLGALVGGAPGRATGGPVSPARPYLVGERGPELFVPTSSGQVVAMQNGPAREVRVAITVNAPGHDAPRALQQSSRQVARAVRAALMEA